MGLGNDKDYMGMLVFVSSQYQYGQGYQLGRCQLLFKAIRHALCMQPEYPVLHSPVPSGVLPNVFSFFSC